MRLFHRLASIGLAVAAWLPVAAASEPPDREHLRVGIAIDVPGSEAAGYPALMIAEADAIWRQHGVSIARMSRDIKPVDVRLTVTFKSRSGVATVWRTGHIAIGGEGRLGAIVFDSSRPADTITLDPDAIAARIKQAPVNGCDLDACPPALLDVVMARALGRVLAHEIGHYLLAWPAHARWGLMRSAFEGRELAGLDRGYFALSAELFPRLRGRLARLRYGQQAAVAAY